MQLVAQLLKSDNPAVPFYPLQTLRLAAGYLSLPPVIYEMGIIIASTSQAYRIEGANVCAAFCVVEHPALKDLDSCWNTLDAVFMPLYC